MNNKQRYAILKKNKEQWLQYYSIKDESGIYILTRYDLDNGFKFAYVGQAKKVLTRLAEHLMGYQHIDLSLKKHGIGSAFTRENKWRCEKVIHCAESELNNM